MVQTEVDYFLYLVFLPPEVKIEMHGCHLKVKPEMTTKPTVLITVLWQKK